MNTLETTTSTPVSGSPAPNRESVALRFLRSVALIGLSLVLTLLIILALLSVPPFQAALESLLVAAQKNTLGGILFMTPWLLPIAMLVLARRFGLTSWRWAGCGWLAIAPVLAYLAADDAPRRLIKLEEIAPAFPGAEKSYAVLMRYDKKHAIPDAIYLKQ